MDRRAFLKHSLLAAGSLTVPPALLSGCGDASSQRVVVDTSRPWWLQGNFASVHDELTAFDLPVRGSLPPELDGLYARNGSNPQNDDSPHWFLGDGMVHGVRLEGGRARWYRNRYVRTGFYEKGVSFDDSIRLGLPPGGANGTSNVSVVFQGGRLLSSGEIGAAFEIDPADLSTVGVFDFGGSVANSFTAHSKVDPATGDLHFFNYWFVPPYLTYYRADREGRVLAAEPIATEKPTMIHSFAVTDREAIFWECPVVFDLADAIDEPLAGFKWTPEYGARIGVLPFGQPGSAIRWVEVEPFYVFHDVNAFREGDDIVLDVCRLPSIFATGDRGDGPSRITRWRIGTGGADLTFGEETVSHSQLDLPTIDRRFTGRPYRYGFFGEFRDHPDTVDLGGVGRIDFQTGSEQIWQPGLHRHAGEALFVPAGAGEGEGYVLSFVYDHVADTSVLAVFESDRLDRGPIAEVDLPRRVPFGFHGWWVPGDAIRA
jgi:carotenoid cleavage dioxygenase-like enzyme